MNIELEDGTIIQNVEKLKDISQINYNTLLYYELGYNRWSIVKNKTEFIRTGKFKQIRNPLEFKKGDVRLNDPKYIKHHNFVFKNKTSFMTN